MNQFCQGMLSFGSSIRKLFLGTCLFNQLVKSDISLQQDSIEQGICLPKKPADILRCHYQDLGSTSLHLREISHMAQPIRNTTWIGDRSLVWKLISMFVLLTLFHGESSGGITKLRFSQAMVLPTYPSPKPSFCPKWEVSVNVTLREG